MIDDKHEDEDLLSGLGNLNPVRRQDSQVSFGSMSKVEVANLGKKSQQNLDKPRHDAFFDLQQEFKSLKI